MTVPIILLLRSEMTTTRPSLPSSRPSFSVTERLSVRSCARKRVTKTLLSVMAMAAGFGPTLAMVLTTTSPRVLITETSSEEKLAKVKELGLQHGINYKQNDYEHAIKELTNGEGVDAVFEMLGGEHTAKSLRCLRDFGRVILYGTATGQQPKFDTASMYAKSSSVHGLWLSRLSLKPEIMRPAWERLSRWIAEGNLRPVIGTVLPLARAAEAFRLMLERKNFGKIVLKI